MSSFISLSSTGSTESTKSTSGDAVSGLREQIFANASVLFPHLAAQSAFQIITFIDSATQQTSALLIHGPDLKREVCLQGEAASDVEGALLALLKGISEAMGWFTATYVGEVKNGVSCAGGIIDLGMVEEGFAFASHARVFGRGG